MTDKMPVVHQRSGLPLQERTEEVVRSEWVLKKNCALRPSQLIAVFTSLASLSVLISAYWAFQGAWVVVPFALLECSALALAFVLYARHSTDREEVSLNEAELVVERLVGSRMTRVVLPRCWLKVQFDQEGAGLVLCQAGPVEVLLGQFVDRESRQRFYQELRASMRRVFD